MDIPRKAYRVVFGVIESEKDLEAISYSVMAETVERAIEISRDLLPKKVQKIYYAREVSLLVGDFDAD